VKRKGRSTNRPDVVTACRDNTWPSWVTSNICAAITHCSLKLLAPVHLLCDATGTLQVASPWASGPMDCRRSDVPLDAPAADILAYACSASTALPSIAVTAPAIHGRGHHRWSWS
jgi:hypothetical protein